MRKLLIGPIFILLLLMFGCAGQQNIIPDFSNMSDKDLVAYAQRIYNDQYDYYMIKANQTNLTDTEKQDLRQLKKWLVEADENIRIYDRIVASGNVPDAALRLKIMLFIERFTY